MPLTRTDEKVYLEEERRKLENERKKILKIIEEEKEMRGTIP